VRILVVWFVFSAALLRAAGWVEFRSGPFQVLSSAGDDIGRETLNDLEQLRNAIGITLGKQDLEPVWPIRIIVRKPERNVAFSPSLALSRDAWIAAIPKLGPETMGSVATVLIDAFPGVIPVHLRRGLITLFSTLQVDNTRVTLGVPPSQKDRDWSRAHMLTVHPDYSGKVRVLLANLGRGIEPAVAYRNAFTRDPEEVETELNSYIEAGKFGTYPVSGKPLNPKKQLLAKEVPPEIGELALADLRAGARDTATAKAAYESLLKRKLGWTPAREGLALLALSSSQNELKEIASQPDAGARPLLEAAKLEANPSQKRILLTTAVKRNPRWAEPHKLLAAMEMDGGARVAALKKAAELEPRDASAWQSLAQAQEAANQFADAGKSWIMAERATDDLEQRERIRQARNDSEQRRVDQQLAAQQEARRKAEQEMQDLKNKALAEIRAAEARANAGKEVIDASKLPEYKDEDESKKVSGVLQRVDCLGSHARLQILSGKTVTRLLVPDPAKVAIGGGGESSFGCGIQKPQRRVTVQYAPRQDVQTGTAGTVTIIEFR
jgi:hypothetical protein